jgi:predicted PhzF superfamily epimerase YddE/YHI9
MISFAGHPTIGSCHAVVEAGIMTPGNGRLVQECAASNLPLRITGAAEERWIHVEAHGAVLIGEYSRRHSAPSPSGDPGWVRADQFGAPRVRI